MITTLKKNTLMVPTSASKKLLTRRQKLRQSVKASNLRKTVKLSPYTAMKDKMKSRRTIQINKSRISRSASERMIV